MINRDDMLSNICDEMGTLSKGGVMGIDEALRTIRQIERIQVHMELLQNELLRLREHAMGSVWDLIEECERLKEKANRTQVEGTLAGMLKMHLAE